MTARKQRRKNDLDGIASDVDKPPAVRLEVEMERFERGLQYEEAYVCG